MAVTQILLVSLVFLVAGLFLKRKTKITFNIRERLLLIFGSLSATVLSLLYFDVKVGGTVRYAVHGWPHFMLWHGLEDVVDKFTIDKWSLAFGSLYIYPLVNYLFYLTLIIFTVLAYKIVRKKDRRDSLMLVYALSVVVIVIFFIWYSSDSNKNRKYIVPTVSVGIGEVAGLKNNGEEKYKDWLAIKQAVFDCEVRSIMQTHARVVTVELKNGGELRAVEPEIDDIFAVEQSVRDKCGQIIMATE